jgi:hypothetical protein
MVMADLTTSVCTDNNCTWQNFSNLIDYIKLNLGALSNALEFTDEEMADIIREHTLPLFSKYNPLIRYYRMTYGENCITENPTYIYQFKNFNYKIMKINNIAPTSSVQDLNVMYSQALRTTRDSTDFLMNMNYLHMSNIAVAPHTWRFMPPDKIEVLRTTDALTFSEDFIVEVACMHNDPTTVSPDLYLLLRDLALADIMIYLGRIRSKFEQFNTPFGEIQTNAQTLLNDGTQLRQQVIENLTNLPPEDYIFFLN